jgi:hypothetical protein
MVTGLSQVTSLGNFWTQSRTSINEQGVRKMTKNFKANPNEHIEERLDF